MLAGYRTQRMRYDRAMLKLTTGRAVRGVHVVGDAHIGYSADQRPIFISDH
jgi:hypothetical protein